MVETAQTARNRKGLFFKLDGSEPGRHELRVMGEGKYNPRGYVRASDHGGKYVDASGTAPPQTMLSKDQALTVTHIDAANVEGFFLSTGAFKSKHGRWPTAAEDIYAATCWAAAAAAELGADPSRVVVGGDSAGANLAAVTALMARDRGGPPIAAQLLLYPVLDADFTTDSYRLFGQGFYNSRTAMQWYWDQYVPNIGDREHPYAAPLHADLTGLPPAVVVIAGHDPLRDEGLAYLDALSRAGVPTVRLHYDGAIHGFLTMPALDLAQRAHRDVATALRELLHRQPAQVGSAMADRARVLTRQEPPRLPD